MLFEKFSLKMYYAYSQNYYSDIYYINFSFQKCNKRCEISHLKCQKIHRKTSAKNEFIQISRHLSLLLKNKHNKYKKHSKMKLFTAALSKIFFIRDLSALLSKIIIVAYLKIILLRAAVKSFVYLYTSSVPSAVILCW